jgi:hypothetical protein
VRKSSPDDLMETETTDQVHFSIDPQEDAVNSNDGLKITNATTACGITVPRIVNLDIEILKHQLSDNTDAKLL